MKKIIKYLTPVVILFFLVFPSIIFAQADCIHEGEYGALVGGSCQSTKCCPGLECKIVPIVVPNAASIATGLPLPDIEGEVPVCFTPQSALAEPAGDANNAATIFKPQISIPGSIKIGEKTFQVQAGQGIQVDGDTFASYMALFFKFFVAAVAVMAVVMIMWGGFKRIYAAGASERISDANDTIISAITGLILALVSMSLLQLINPKLVELPTIDARPVKVEYLDWESDAQLFSQAEPELTGIIESPNTLRLKYSDITVDEVVEEGISSAYSNLLARGYGMYITSGYRSPQEQQREINKNCPADATSSNQCRPPTCLLLNGPNSCPHTSGQAVDVWGTTLSGAVCIKGILPDPNMTLSGYCSTKEGRQKCLDNECQKVLIEEMKKQGFCRLCSEPWHFEKPKMSPGCTC